MEKGHLHRKRSQGNELKSIECTRMEQWISVIPEALYTLHRDSDTETLFSIVSVPVPVPVLCSMYEP